MKATRFDLIFCSCVQAHYFFYRTCDLSKRVRNGHNHFTMSDKTKPLPPPPAPHFTRGVPDGDTHERYVCGKCGHIHYTNPKIVVGSVVMHENRILLCKRAIEPRIGFWTLPAGYLEEHETPEDGARREAREEACANIALDALLAVYTMSHISQVQLMYRGHLIAPGIAAGPESLEVRLFAWDEIRGANWPFLCKMGAGSFSRCRGQIGFRALWQSATSRPPEGM